MDWTPTGNVRLGYEAIEAVPQLDFGSPGRSDVAPGGGGAVVTVRIVRCFRGEVDENWRFWNSRGELGDGGCEVDPRH